MIKPFQIIWELIEFLLQALFVYILAIIVIVGLITYTIITLENERQQLIIEKPKYIYSKEHIEKTKECTRISGCRVLEDGTIEY
tara:strand:+ start:149 stop:400 length:252 start_codon:yes stop_codon:yes gene_type:complete